MSPLKSRISFGILFVLVVVIMLLATRQRHRSLQVDPLQREFALVRERQKNPIEATDRQLKERIAPYLQGETNALPFLNEKATNISLIRVSSSANTNMPCVDAVMLANGQRHHLEIPISL